jgi:hypothetical protein
LVQKVGNPRWTWDPDTEWNLCGSSISTWSLAPMPYWGVCSGEDIPEDRLSEISKWKGRPVWTMCYRLDPCTSAFLFQLVPSLTWEPNHILKSLCCIPGPQSQCSGSLSSFPEWM